MIGLKRFIVISILGWIVSAPIFADSLTLWNRNYDSAPVDKIIALALEKTADFGEVELVRSEPIEQADAINALASDQQLDLLSAASSSETEAKLLAVNFPVLRGLLGHRVCLIRKGDQGRFEGIETAYDFYSSDISVCQGEAWPDTKVLQRNGFKVWTSPIYKQLFEDLKSGRCDCFLRGAQEVYPEYKAHETELDIEENLVVFYRQPGLIYVNRNRPLLAARIELGLLRALDDGSLESTVEDLLGDALERLSLPSRKYLNLNNPLLSNEMKRLSKMESLWF